MKWIKNMFSRRLDKENNVQKLEDYEYRVIDTLVKLDITNAYELADCLGLSLSRARYEIKKSKDRLDARSTTEGR